MGYNELNQQRACPCGASALAGGAVRTAVNMIEDGAESGWQVATSNRVVMGGPAGETWKMGRSQF